MTATTVSGSHGEMEVSVEQKLINTDNPHRDPQVLKHLYHGKRLSTYECADRLGCSHTAVQYHLKKNGIERRERPEWLEGTQRVERATHGFEATRERWQVCEPESTKSVGVHQLTAIADGAEPAEVFSESTNVHHRNGHAWDNRHDNLEVLSASEHGSVHRNAAWRFSDELGCEVLVTAETGGSDA